MRPEAPNPNFTEIRQRIKAHHAQRPPEDAEPIFKDFDHMTQAVIEASVFTDRTPETERPEI